ncbi:hypothetical protein AC739_19595, partial [Planococcus glaciei]|uniref:glycosyltransferase n=1 Tax=Planococcus glaciei TaxID=459472 RepID=UPI0006C48379
IVVDNNSLDESVNHLRKKFSNKNNLKIVESKENLGFGKANNCGVNTSQGDILIFLNSDTIVNDTDFQKLISLMNENIGFLSCKILNRDGSIQSLGFKYPSVINDFKLSLLFWNFNFVKKLRFKNYNNQGLKKVDWVSGCFMICQKEDFKKIGGFDPEIFMYSEDIDICKNMEIIGKSNYIYD